MQLATGGDMLNFGYWKDAVEPVAAQKALCSLVGEEAELGSARTLIDVGSGLSAPAAYWKSRYKNLDVVCVNINYCQLAASRKADASLVNATSTLLPFSDSSMDRVIALESSQHFKPLEQFTRECRRVLKPGGLLVMAIPVVKVRSAFFKLGILSFTWSSERYHLDYVKSAIVKNGFDIAGTAEIGRHVYEPLADYYSLNRPALRKKILQEYPPFLESVLYRSMLKMKGVSQKQAIGYGVIKCVARQ